MTSTYTRLIVITVIIVIFTWKMVIRVVACIELTWSTSRCADVPSTSTPLRAGEETEDECLPLSELLIGIQRLPLLPGRYHSQHHLLH